MRGRLAMATAAAMGLCLLARPVLAQFPPVTDPSKEEQKCQKSAGSVLVKFVGAKTKCISKCISAARKVDPFVTPGGCFGPGFTDPTTFNCVFDTTKGAEAKAAAGIVKACNPEPGHDRCPECYDPAVCTVNSGLNPFVHDTEGQIDPFGNLIYCTEVGGTNPTKAEAKCEDTVTKSLVKFVGAKTKCYQKCNDNVFKGKLAPGSCDPPVPADPATQACIFDSVKGAETKAAAAIDKVCEVAGSKPACYSTQVGAGWVALVESNID